MTYLQTRQRPAATGRQGTYNNTSSKNSITNLDPASLLLGRLEGVIQTGKGWRARCPSHGGRTASLAIAQGDNGTLLVHCFASCEVHDVLAAVGLEVGDLFVRRDLKSMSPAERSQLRQAALLPKWKAAHEVLIHEAGVVLAAADQLADNEPLDKEDLTRLKIAALRIFDAQAALEVRS
jgi:hypothetical protein